MPSALRARARRRRRRRDRARARASSSARGGGSRRRCGIADGATGGQPPCVRRDQRAAVPRHRGSSLAPGVRELDRDRHRRRLRRARASTSASAASQRVGVQAEAAGRDAADRASTAVASMTSSPAPECSQLAPVDRGASRWRGRRRPSTGTSARRRCDCATSRRASARGSNRCMRYGTAERGDGPAAASRHREDVWIARYGADDDQRTVTS